MFNFEIHFVEALVSAIAGMVIGALWYSPVLFAKPWMKLSGVDMNNKEQMEKMKKESGPAMGGMFVCLLVMALVFEIFINTFNFVDLTQALLFGFLGWLGFTAANGFSGVLFERRPVMLFVLNTGYYLVSTLVMVLIQYLWK